MSSKFSDIITFYENSLRGISNINGKNVKAFPHAAGSVFISRIVSLLKTVVNEKNIYSNLDSDTSRERIYKNGEALAIMMVTSETVPDENMLFIFEGFQNISIDTYTGMKKEGVYGKLQKDLREFEQQEPQEEERLAYD